MTMSVEAPAPPSIRRPTAAERERLRRALPESVVLFDEPMTRHTSFRIGGPADVLLMPRSVADLQRIVILARELELPLTVIGNGSNLLVRDGGLRGLVLKIAENLARMEFEGNRLWSQAGALLKEVSQAAGGRSFSGLEFAIGIPGTLGGAVIMNAGAYGGEMKDVVVRVTAVDEAGEVRAMTPADLCFAYRSSALQGRRWIVADATMELAPGDPAAIRAKMADLTEQRESKQPLSMPSAGSVFKRPPGRFVGPMIEELGLKGYRLGGAQVSEKHAGFLVNAGGASARDVLQLIQLVRERVQERFEVWLETEVKVIGEEA
jgi:UDP-N-acetylmuramate dehydrogenase